MQPFCHNNHKDQKDHKKYREKGNGYVLGDQAKQRRHKTGAGIGKCHLYADNGLAQFRSEINGCFVDNGGINRRAAAADKDQPGQKQAVAAR